MKTLDRCGGRGMDAGARCVGAGGTGRRSGLAHGPAHLIETSSRRVASAEYSSCVGAASIILASRSPRRRQLLCEFGFAGHEAVHPGFEDAGLKNWTSSAAAWVASLAYLKAWARARDAGSAGRVVIGADTACLMDGQLIGTPTTPDEARAMIRAFMGREHEVLTGVAIIDLRGGGGLGSDSPVSRVMFTDRARVQMGVLSEEQIEGYVSGGGWEGKAGGYNYREAAAAGWPISHSGDVTTIMGLPMRRLVTALARLNLHPTGAPGGAVAGAAEGALA